MEIKPASASGADPLKPGGDADGRPSLAVVLGEEMIANALHPFIDYLETAVSVHEVDGAQVGEVLTGNEYCRILHSAGKQAGKSCRSAAAQVARAAIAGSREEMRCPGGMTIVAYPIIAIDQTIGACVGCVSEPPTGTAEIRTAARQCQADFKQLQEAAAQFYHKPDYLYDAARKHLEQLARSLGSLYCNIRVKDEAVIDMARREAELAEARELDKSILSSAATSIIAVDRELRISVWNQATETITGIPGVAAVGRRLSDILSEAGGPEFCQIVGGVIASGEAWRHGQPVNFDFPGGSNVVLSSTVTPLRNALGEIGGALVLSENVTEEDRLRRQVNRHMRELEAINELITTTNSTLDKDAVLASAADAFKAATGAELIVIFLCGPEKSFLLPAQFSGQAAAESLLGIRVRMGVGPVGAAAESRETRVAYDLRQEKACAFTAALRQQTPEFASMVAVPLKTNDEILGVLAAYSSSEGICSAVRVDFIELLADQLSISLQNAQLYTETCETGSFLTSLMDGMAEGVFTADEHSCFSYINPGMEAITGYTSKDLCGKNVLSVVAGDQRELVSAMIARRRAGHTDRYDVDVIRKDGRRITISQTVSPLRRGDRIVGAIGVITDITERLNLEQRLMEQNQRLSLLQSVTARSVSGLASGKALQTLVDETVAVFGYPLCSIFMPDADGTRLQLVVNHGYDPEFVRRLNDDGTFRLDNKCFAGTPAAQAFLRCRQEVLSDIPVLETDPLLKKAASEYDFRSVAATPMEYFGEQLGVFTVCSCKAEGFDAAELEFLSAVAGVAASIAGSGMIFNRLAASERRYRDLYDTAADWMYTLDREGRVLDCNDTMARRLGYPKDEILSRHIYDFGDEDERGRARLDLEETFRQGVFSTERSFITATGDPVAIEINASFVYDEHEKAYQWRVIGRDVTDKHEVERRVRLLAAAIENAQECVIVTDLEGSVLSVNAAGAGYFGYAQEAMNGMRLTDLWAGRNPAGLEEEIIRASLGRGWQGQLWYRRADGSEFPAFVSSQRVDDDGGNPLALVAISRDISAEHHMTTEILRRNRELAVLNAVTSMAAKSLDLESILGSCINSVVESMHYDSGMVFLLSEDGKYLDAHVPVNIPDDMLARVRQIEVGSGYVSRIAASGEAIFIDDSRDSRIRLEGMPDRLDFASLGGVPLLSKDRMMGVMMVGTVERRVFGEHEQNLLESVGKTIGAAVDNARLFTSVVEAKSEWETTFDAMTNGVSIHSPDFTIVRANRALAELLGTTTKELIGKKCYRVFHGLDQPIDGCPHRQAVAGGKSASLVVDEPTLGKTLSISADPFFSSRGLVRGTVHDVRDITEQEQLRDQVNQADKLSALGEMAGGVAHDFNNFLTVILGNAQLLLGDSKLDSEDRELLKTIERVAGDAAETVRRVQEFTRVRTSRSFELVDVNQVIRNAIEVARPHWKDEANARGVAIGLELDIADVPWVRASESELGEVIVNLLVNAADATDKNGHISIASHVENDHVVVSVSDEGCGMSEEQLRRVFEPFYSTKGSGGSGLGLSVAYGIITRHGGKISAQSRKGKGSVFTVELPVVQPVETAEQTEAQEPEPVRAVRVLVIDDAVLIRRLLDGMLRGMGHQVETAGSGQDGIGLFEKAIAAGREFDLVLTDLGMPGMSGWDVAEIVKSASPETPVALITGWGDQLDPEKMKQSKVDAVIAKPFSLEQIRNLVGRIVPPIG